VDFVINHCAAKKLNFEPGNLLVFISVTSKVREVFQADSSHIFTYLLLFLNKLLK